MKKIRLKEICDLQNGYAFKSTDYIEKSNTLNCRMSNIRPGAVFDIEYSPKYLPDEFVKEYEEFILKDGDIVIAMTDLAGDPKILGVPAEVNTKGKNVLLNQRVGKLKIKNKDKIYYSYLKYVLSNPANKEYYKKFAGGGLQLNISKKDILNLEIPIYEINKQMEISNKLDKIQEIINIRKKQIEQLDELIKSQFVEMFDIPLNRLKSNQTVSLDTVYKNINVGYVGQAKDDYVSSGIPYLRTQNVRVNHIDLNGLIYIKDEFHKKNKKSIVYPGDIVVSRVGVNRGMAAVIPNNIKEANIANCLIIKKNSNVNSTYISYFLNNSFGTDPKFGSTVGSAQGVINTSVLRKWQVYIPSIELQNKFARIVEQIDKQKFEIQKSLEETQNLQESLMNKYFGG